MTSDATKWLIYEPVKAVVTRIMPELAIEIGLNESIVLLQISFWLSTCNNVEDGKYWTYQTLRDMKDKAFPYWSIETIRRTIKNLADKKYIFVGNFNSRKGDRTQWFALNPDKLSELTSIVTLPEEKYNLVSKRDKVSQNETPTQQNETTLPEITTETTQKKDNTRKRDPFYDAIAEVWKSSASGWIVNVKGMMLGTAKRGEWERCNFTPPVTDPAEILAFAPYMERRKREKKIDGDITACVTIQRWFYDFRAENAKKLIKLDASPVDLTQWETPDPFAFLESEGA